MSLTKILENYVTVPTSAGAASSISSATCVRLANAANQTVTIGISTYVGAATTNYFVMVHDSVEFLQKSPTDVIWANNAVTANKVAFTN